MSLVFQSAVQQFPKGAAPVQLPPTAGTAAAPTSGGGLGHILKEAAIFGGVGAVAGFGVGLLPFAFIPFSAPICAAIGGAAGAALGAFKGWRDNKNAAAQANGGAAMLPGAAVSVRL
jgi:hypothetical protein